MNWDSEAHLSSRRVRIGVTTFVLVLLIIVGCATTEDAVQVAQDATETASTLIPKELVKQYGWKPSWAISAWMAATNTASFVTAWLLRGRRSK